MRLGLRHTASPVVAVFLVGTVFFMGTVLVAPRARAAPASASKQCGTGPKQLNITLPPELYRSNLPRALCDWLDTGSRSLRFLRETEEGGSTAGAGTDVLTVRHAQEVTRIELERDGAAVMGRSLPRMMQPNVVDEERLAQAVSSMLAAADDPSLAMALQESSAPRQAPPVEAAKSPAAPAAAKSKSTSPSSAATAAPPAGPVVSGTVDPATDEASPTRAGQALARRTLTTALGYRAILRGDEPLYHGPELELQATTFSTGNLDWFVAARAGLWGPGNTQIESLSLSLEGSSFGAGLGVLRRLGFWSVRGSVDYTLEPTRTEVTPLREDPELRPLTEGNTALRHFVGLGLGAGLHWRGFELRVRASARYQLSRSTYRVRESAEEAVVSEPWRVQPGARLLLGYRW